MISSDVGLQRATFWSRMCGEAFFFIHPPYIPNNDIADTMIYYIYIR